MANVDRPNGLRPAKSLIGAPWNALVRKYEAADRSADTTGNHGDIYIGDVVELVSGKVQVADSGDTVLGVVVGVGSSSGIQHGEAGPFDASSLEKRYLGAAEDGYVYVVPADSVLFEAQTDSALSLVAGDEASLTNAAGTSHGDQSTGQSSTELQAVGAGTADVVVVEDNTNPNNDTTLANARHLVKFINVA